jgi:hypothetical protein
MDNILSIGGASEFVMPCFTSHVVNFKKLNKI